MKKTVETLGEKIGLLFLGALATIPFGSLANADGTAPAVPGGTEAAAPLAQNQPPGFMSMLPLFAAMFAVVYFLMIRPQQKKLKEQQELLNQLKQGDEVLTASGILGTITGLTDKVVTLEIADKVRIKLLKSQVAQVVKGPLI